MRESRLLVACCAVLLLPQGTGAATVVQESGPETAKRIKVGEVVQLKGGPALTVTLDSEGTWSDVPALAGSAKGRLSTVILTFSGPTGVIGFDVARITLTAGTEKRTPIGILVSNETVGAPPKWVLLHGSTRSLGIIFRGRSILQDGMVFADKTGQARFLGHTAARLYLVYDIPPELASKNMLLQLHLDVVVSEGVTERNALAVQLE
jgi:hypothetical protein